MKQHNLTGFEAWDILHDRLIEHRRSMQHKYAAGGAAAMPKSKENSRSRT